MNLIAVATFLLNTLYTVVFATLDADTFRLLIQLNIAWNISYVAVLAANHFGRFRLAMWMLAGVGAANTLAAAAILGRDTGIYLFLMTTPALGALIARPADKVLSAALGVGTILLVTIGVVFTESPPVLDGTVLQTVIFAASLAGTALMIGLITLHHSTLVARAEEALNEAHARSERLLLNILPTPIAERLKADESPIADRIDSVTVLFADLVDSTPLAELLAADDLVALLDRLFSRFDDLADAHGLEKITTIGDGYLAVAGAPIPRPDHAEAAAKMAIAMRDSLATFTVDGYGQLRMRFGLHTGPVVAGVIGKRKFRYDLWGDTVNTAARMESHGEPGMIHVTAAVWEALEGRFGFRPRGVIPVKGKGEMETYFLVNAQSRQAAEPTAPRHRSSAAPPIRGPSPDPAPRHPRHATSASSGCHA